MTVTYDWLKDTTTVVSNVDTDIVYPVGTSFTVITTVLRRPVSGSIGIKVTKGATSLYYAYGPMTGDNVVNAVVSMDHIAVEWNNTTNTVVPYCSMDGVMWELCPMPLDEAGVPMPPPTFTAPTHAGLFFDAGDPLLQETVVFGSPRVFSGSLFVQSEDVMRYEIPAVSETLAPIGAVPATQPEPISISEEAIIHALVGAPFGDLEFDVGKSVGWLQRFVDDIFVSDVNLGDQRYWVVNWTKSFAHTYARFTGLNFFAEPEAYREGQILDSAKYAANYPTQLVYDDNDWVIFLDAHEGLSTDTRSLPDDYIVSPFKSYMYREIARANAAGRDRIIMPFYIFLRHDHIQNVGQSYSFEGQKFMARQSAGVPYYLPYQGLTRMFKVSALREPDFDWALLDTPVPFPQDEGVADAYINPTVGTASAPNTPGLQISSDVRYTAKVRAEFPVGTVDRFLGSQWSGSVTTGQWFTGSRVGQFNVGMYNTSGIRFDFAPFTNLQQQAALPVSQDAYIGWQFLQNDPASTPTGRGSASGITSTDGSNWTVTGQRSLAPSTWFPRGGTLPVLIGSHGTPAVNWQERIYWAQMERINQRQFIFSGASGNVMSLPDTAAKIMPVGDVEIVARVSCPAWAVDNRVVLAKNGCFYFEVSDKIHAWWTTAGGSVFPVSTNHGFADGSTGWVKATRVVATGLVSFYSAPDSPIEPTVWTARGTGASPAGLLSFPATPFEVGAYNITADPYQGRILRVILRNGIGGTPVIDVSENDATGWTAGPFPSSSPRFVILPGTTGNSLSTPDAAALDITGTEGTAPTQGITIVARVALADWTPGGQQTLVAKWFGSPNLSYMFRMDAGGTLSFVWSSTGTTPTGVLSSSVIVGVPDGSWKWIAATLNTDNGAAGNDVRFWTSDDGVTWTQLGVTRNTVGVTSIFSGTTNLYIGTQSNGATEPLNGNVSHVSIRRGVGAGGTVGGTETFRFDAQADLANSDPAALTFVTGTNQTVTVNRSGSPSALIVSHRVTQTGSVIQTAPNELIWRFDANDYPGTGTSYVDPRGRTWTLTTAAAITPFQSPDVKLQIVSYAYAHWNLPDVPPGQTSVPPLDANNDDGWKQRCLISQVLPVTGLPVGTAVDPVGTWKDPALFPDPLGKRGPWAFDVYSDQITDPEIPSPPPPVALETSAIRVPMYDLVFRLNVRDGVWYTTGDTGNTEVVWDPTLEEFVSFVPPITGPDLIIVGAQHALTSSLVTLALPFTNLVVANASNAVTSPSLTLVLGGTFTNLVVANGFLAITSTGAVVPV